MASKAHDFILQMIWTAMQQRGYTIVSVDGDTTKISDLDFKTPPTLKRHRPDMIGIQVKSGKICIGEAKTNSDLNSDRTYNQFEDFSNIILDNYEKAELIIGIPMNSEKKLNKILKNLDLIHKKNVFILKIPNGLLSI